MTGGLPGRPLARLAIKTPQNYKVACRPVSDPSEFRHPSSHSSPIAVVPPDSDTLVRLLAAARQGDADALNTLAPLVYDELRRIARRQMRHERQGHTLQPTALANEAWARLMGARHLDVQDRSHFMGIASNAMRQILVERARAHRAAKRGGAAHRVTLDEGMLAGDVRPIDIEALDEALTRLEASNPELARIVELRFFGGLTVEETAEQLDSSPATIKRRWTLAKAWLLRELEGRRPA
jgi:RNA polymerase sigma-70 factor, ECF subfamily